MRLKGYTARKPQKRVASREIISVRSVKSVWDLKLRFPQVFEDEETPSVLIKGGRTGGRLMMLARMSYLICLRYTA